MRRSFLAIASVLLLAGAAQAQTVAPSPRASLDSIAVQPDAGGAHAVAAARRHAIPAGQPEVGAPQPNPAAAQRPDQVGGRLCYDPGIPGTADVIIPGIPGTPAIGDMPATPGAPDILIPGNPGTPGFWYPCR